MPETDKEIRRHTSRALACVIPFLFCTGAGGAALGVPAPLNPFPVGIVLMVGAVGWAWLFILSLRELDYLGKLKVARWYWGA